ncbi:MAG: hypothetical protein JRJ57_00250 [Deltaproteobacteria bacterium]|nr:hypothetical protein [Deltaproteobacteria bacterium]
MSIDCKPHIIPGLAHQQVKIPVSITGNLVPDPKFFKLLGPLTMGVIQKKVADEFNIPVRDLIYGNNSPRYSLPRMVSMYMCEKYLKGKNLTSIAIAHNKDNHSSVNYSRKKVEGFMDVYPEFRERIKRIHAEIRRHQNSTPAFPDKWRHKR